MSDFVTVGGNTASSYSGQLLNVVSSSPTIGGSSDTVQSSVSGISFVLTGADNSIFLTGSSDTLTAGLSEASGAYGDTLLVQGNQNYIIDYGFNDGSVTIDGSYNYFTSQQRIETSNIVVNGSNNTVSASYLSGNFIINGDNVLVYANNGNFTVAGANDTVIAANATSILVTGSSDKVVDEAAAGSAIPSALLTGASVALQDTTPGTSITISGSGDSVTAYNNNNTITSSGDSSAINLESYGNSATIAGGNSSIAAQSTTETISVGGSNATVTTSTFQAGSSSSTVPASTVSVAPSVTSSITYNNGSSSITDTTPGSGASTVNVTSTGTSVVATSGNTYKDSVGGNHYTIGGGTKLNLTAGKDTVTVQNGQMLTQDTLGGTASAPNTVILGSSSYFNFTSGGVTSSYDVLSLSGSYNSGFIYGSSQDTIYAGGSGNLVSVLEDSNASSAGTVLVITGNDTLDIWSDNNSIQASGGSILYVTSDNNSISGANFNLTLQGTGNSIDLTGNATVSDASPWSYETATGSSSVQNQFTVMGGQFNLGGKDALLQTSGSAAISLAGGNNVTLNGANDSVTAYDQVYAGNNIVVNGANDSVSLVNMSDSAATISASVSAYVTATDDSGKEIGKTNTNSDERLVFIGGSGTSSTVLAAGSNTQVTLFGGASSNNVVSGGDAGNNSLNGGTGSGDLFTAGGNNDVLIGGSGGANTLVSATGNETLTGAGLGNDLFSITGGGGTDMITNFTGSLTLGSGLSVASESVSGGSLNVYLNDGTHIIFAGLSSVTQTGNLFTN